MSVKSNLARDISFLFMRSEVNRWLNSDFSSIDIKLERYKLLEKNRGKSYLHVLKNAYKTIVQHYPNEYVLKNEFLNQKIKQLLGTGKSVVFNEFRIGKAIADLVLFNGDSKVFEIKTILDKEYRLDKQLAEYKKLFNFVFIIVPLELFDKYVAYDNEVGVITYDQNSNSFAIKREAHRNRFMDVDVLMEVLHTKEYLKIVADNLELPENMNAFNQFEIAKRIISTIPADRLNRLFIETMKARNVNNQFFNKVNSEFNQICLSMNLKKAERDCMITNLKAHYMMKGTIM